MFPVNQAHAPDAVTTPPMPPAINTDRPTVGGQPVGDRTSNTADLTARTRIFPAEASPSARAGHARRQPVDWLPIEPLEEPLEEPLDTAPTAPVITEKNVLQSATSTLDSAPRKELSRLLKRFKSGDIDLPQAAAGVYADVLITEYKLRLYALVWAVEALLEPELSLFLILGPTQGSYLPMDTQLTVKENNLLLTEQTLRWTSAPTYLYTQVFGTWKEKFTVEIALPYARPLSLPPLTFALDAP
ncbi:MAG: hypothetical protein AAFP03_10370 [Cyanobacteria bacterium J06598_3]